MGAEDHGVSFCELLCIETVRALEPSGFDLLGVSKVFPLSKSGPSVVCKGEVKVKRKKRATAITSAAVDAQFLVLWKAHLGKLFLRHLQFVINELINGGSNPLTPKEQAVAAVFLLPATHYTVLTLEAVNGWIGFKPVEEAHGIRSLGDPI